MNFGNNILKYRDDIIKDLAKLVSIESVRSEPLEGMPFGKNCAKALSCILDMADTMGFATKNVGNYAGHAEYGKGDEVAAVVAHVDIVPAGEGWETNPFVLTQKGNLLLGRGTADDKGAAIAALYCLKALKDEKVIPKRKLRVIFGAGEETGSSDLKMYLQSEQMPVIAFTPDSEYGICNREKGILRLQITSKEKTSDVVKKFISGTVVNAVPSKAETFICCAEDEYNKLVENSKDINGIFKFEKINNGANIVSIGKASHAMQPQEGFNAATHLLKLLETVFQKDKLGNLISFINDKIGVELDGKSLNVDFCDKESGPLTLNLGLVNIDEKNCSIGLDIRYPVTAEGDNIFNNIKNSALKYGLDVILKKDNKPLFLPEESTFIKLLKDSYFSMTGQNANIYSTGGGTYARAFGGRAVAFGPLFADEPDRRLHNANENIDIDRFMMHAQICLEAMYRMITF